jgi:phosphatidylserine/phosphatidylglycerophosphate/cardiolipin synthase-like enzyme
VRNGDRLLPGDGYVPVARRAAYPLRAGNRVRPLVDGEAAFRRICEAVEAARGSVWVTVAYLERDLQLPDGRGSLFDVLDLAVARGLDVRALFWREPRLPEIEPESSHFEGNQKERAWLAARRSRFLARWDRLPDEYCQHQKSWLVDAGLPSELVFVGGINLDAASICPAGHAAREGEQIHDVYAELCGPAATDVHHNFVQRWNQASERAARDGSWPNPEAAGDLEFPALPSPAAGEVPVQITRTLMAQRYTSETATPGGEPFATAGGEESVLEQYLAAIAAARRTLYIENQVIASPVIADALRTALDRGVEVVFLVPGDPHPAFVEARENPRAAFLFEKLEQLGHYPNFTLAAIAGSRGAGRYQEIYVHAKIALVDDAWATIGSTNIVERSFRRDTELNASFWHAPTVRALREELLQEHLGRDTSGLDDRVALRLYREIALRNRDRRARREPLEGLAYALEPRDYGCRKSD